MARIAVPQQIIEECDQLFEAYMAQKQGPFSHDDLIAYVEKNGTDELLKYHHENTGIELFK